MITYLDDYRPSVALVDPKTLNIHVILVVTIEEMAVGNVPIMCDGAMRALCNKLLAELST